MRRTSDDGGRIVPSESRARIVGRDVAVLTEEIKDRQRRERREAKKCYRTGEKREDGERERNEKERVAAEATKR